MTVPNLDFDDIISEAWVDAVKDDVNANTAWRVANGAQVGTNKTNIATNTTNIARRLPIRVNTAPNMTDAGNSECGQVFGVKHGTDNGTNTTLDSTRRHVGPDVILQANRAGGFFLVNGTFDFNIGNPQTAAGAAVGWLRWRLPSGTWAYADNEVIANPGNTEGLRLTVSSHWVIPITPEGQYRFQLYAGEVGGNPGPTTVQGNHTKLTVVAYI